MNVPNYKGRKSRGLPRGVGANCGLHPLIHSFDSEGQNTTSWDKGNGARVWIKVCNIKSPGASTGLHIVMLRLLNCATGTTARYRLIIRACFAKN